MGVQGQLTINPSPAMIINELDELILIGSAEAEKSFSEIFSKG
jgi:K+/H+ antiporter YhaU regulatory subunit KhtT